MADFDVKMDRDAFSKARGKKVETRYIKPKRIRERGEQHMRFDKALDLARAVDVSRDARFYSIVSGNFIFGDFIEALVFEHKLHVKCLTLSTLSLSQANVDSLANILVAGLCDELNLILSHYFYSNYRNDLIPYCYVELDRENRFQLAVCGTHCKIALLETDDGRKFVLHGSANLRSSGNIEQFAFEENAELYDFNKEICDDIMKSYQTINKAIRGNTLWQVVQNPQEVEKGKRSHAKKARQRNGAQ